MLPLKFLNIAGTKISGFPAKEAIYHLQVVIRFFNRIYVVGISNKLLIKHFSHLLRHKVTSGVSQMASMES